jgi:hypothetical protein
MSHQLEMCLVKGIKSFSTSQGLLSVLACGRVAMDFANIIVDVLIVCANTKS